MNTSSQNLKKHKKNKQIRWPSRYLKYCFDFFNIHLFNNLVSECALNYNNNNNNNNLLTCLVYIAEGEIPSTNWGHLN